jgi:hypothetical protein
MNEAAEVLRNTNCQLALGVMLEGCYLSWVEALRAPGLNDSVQAQVFEGDPVEARRYFIQLCDVTQEPGAGLAGRCEGALLLARRFKRRLPYYMRRAEVVGDE